jgi:hypothetical protein
MEIDTYQTLVGDFEGAGARHLIENLHSFIFIWNQVTVEIIVQVGLGDLIPQDDRIWQALKDRRRYYR